MSSQRVLTRSRAEVLFDIRRSLDVVRHVRGGVYVFCLVKNVRKDLPYFYLEQLHFEDGFVFDFEVADADMVDSASMSLFHSSIEMCDHRTRDEVLKRLSEVRSKIQYCIDTGDSECLYDLESEKEHLVSYLAEVLYPDGRIRMFRDNIYKIRDTVSKNVRRFLDELSEHDAELSSHLRHCIVHSRFSVVYDDIA